MIKIDSRSGSKELFPLFSPGTAELTTLSFGDFAFIGNGSGGKKLTIGIERKTAGDLLTCIKDGRISEQLLGMRQMYDVSYLLHEAHYRERADGYLEYLQNGGWFQTQFAFKHIWGFLITVQLRAGVRLFHTRTMKESAAWITSLHSWFTEKKWEEHRSCLAPHIDLDPEFRKGRQGISLLRRFLAQLDGIGHEKAKEIESYAGNIDFLMTMTDSDFMKIPGIGKTLSKSIWTEIHG